MSRRDRGWDIFHGASARMAESHRRVRQQLVSQGCPGWLVYGVLDLGEVCDPVCREVHQHIARIDKACGDALAADHSNWQKDPVVYASELEEKADTVERYKRRDSRLRMLAEDLLSYLGVPAPAAE